MAKGPLHKPVKLMVNLLDFKFSFLQFFNTNYFSFWLTP